MTHFTNEELKGCSFCTIFLSGVITSVGWALNALAIGLKGKKCHKVEIF